MKFSLPAPMVKSFKDIQLNFERVASQFNMPPSVLSHESVNSYTETSTSFVDLPGSFTGINISDPGRYVVLFGFQGGTGAVASPSPGATDDVSAVAADTVAGENTSVSRGTVRSLATGTVTLAVRSTGAGTAGFAKPWIIAWRVA